MPDPISRDQADFALGRMMYNVTNEQDGIVRYVNSDYPGSPERFLHFDFGDGPIPWEDFRTQLEYEGVEVSVFLTHLSDF